MKHIHSTFKNSIAVLLLVALLVPHFAFAQGPVVDFFNLIVNGKTATEQSIETGQTVQQIRQEIMKKIGTAIAKRALQKVTAETVTWINGGFSKEGPLFVQNTKSFYNNIKDVHVKDVVETVGYDITHFPYGREIAKGIVQGYQNERGDLWSSGFNLDQAIGPNWQGFYGDISQGGWTGWNALFQNPENNIFGAQQKAVEVLQKKKQAAVDAAKEEIKNGMGFLGQKTCKKYRKDNRPMVAEDVEDKNGSSNYHGTGRSYDEGPSGFNRNQFTTELELEMGLAAAWANWDAINWTAAKKAEYLAGQHAAEQITEQQDCVEYVTKTPGSLVSSQIMTAMGSKFRQNELAMAFGNSLSQIFDALGTQLVNKGLSALSNYANGGPNGSENQGQEESDWNYYGLRLAKPDDPNAPENENASFDWQSAPDIVVDLDKVLLEEKFKNATCDADGNPISVVDPNIQTKPCVLPDGYITDKNYYLANPNKGGIAIKQTLEELALYEKKDTGILDLTKKLPGAIQALDRAIPGPDFGWQERFQSEYDRATTVLANKAGRKDDDKWAEALSTAKRQLPKVRYAIRNWVGEKNLTEANEALAVVSRVASANIDNKSHTEERLKLLEIKGRLLTLRKDYLNDPNKVNEYLKRYYTMQSSIPSEETISRVENTRASLEQRLAEVNEYTQKVNAAKADPTNNISDWVFYYDNEDATGHRNKDNDAKSEAGNNWQQVSSMFTDSYRQTDARALNIAAQGLSDTQKWNWFSAKNHCIPLEFNFPLPPLPNWNYSVQNCVNQVRDNGYELPQSCQSPQSTWPLPGSAAYAGFLTNIFNLMNGVVTSLIQSYVDDLKVPTGKEFIEALSQNLQSTANTASGQVKCPIELLSKKLRKIEKAIDKERAYFCGRHLPYNSASQTGINGNVFSYDDTSNDDDNGSYYLEMRCSRFYDADISVYTGDDSY